MRIQCNYLDFATGSALIEFGRTRVLCTASVEEKVPPWMRGQRRGWVTAEYSMLPGATPTRSSREVTRGKAGGRTLEIQRLIGRSLRAVVDMEALGQRTIWLDCDVLQADGGTRTASITGAFVALSLALHKLRATGQLPALPLRGSVAAVSAGVVGGATLLDLPYEEDSRAEVDMNFVVAGNGDLIEVQGTAEREPFSRATLDRLTDLALAGCARLDSLQRDVLAAEGIELPVS